MLKEEIDYHYMGKDRSRQMALRLSVSIGKGKLGLGTLVRSGESGRTLGS